METSPRPSSMRSSNTARTQNPATPTRLHGNFGLPPAVSAAFSIVQVKGWAGMARSISTEFPMTISAYLPRSSSPPPSLDCLSGRGRSGNLAPVKALGRGVSNAPSDCLGNRAGRSNRFPALAGPHPAFVALYATGRRAPRTVGFAGAGILGIPLKLAESVPPAAISGKLRSVPAAANRPRMRSGTFRSEARRLGKTGH